MHKRKANYGERSAPRTALFIVNYVQKCNYTNYEVPTGALDSKNAKNLMEKLSSLNQEEQATILMATHDSGAASFCKRILFIQDGVIFHEIRRGDESRQDFYQRILKVMAQLGGGRCNVL